MKKIKLVNISKTFETQTDDGKTVRITKALKPTNLSFFVGETHAILGENGAGKSTLVKILSGLHSPSFGSIFFDDKKFNSISTKQAKKSRIAIVNQQALLSENLSVLENISLYDKGFWASKNKKLKKIKALASEFGINLDLKKKASCLSGLEKFYTECLIALWSKPDFLILDEPASILDLKDYDVFFAKLKEKTKFNFGLILITHNIGEAKKWANKISILKKGSLVFSENNSDNLTEEKISEVLFAKNFTQSEKVKNEKLKSKDTNHVNLTSKEKSLKKDNASKKNKLVFASRDLVFTSDYKNQDFTANFTLAKNSITAIYSEEDRVLKSLEDALFGMKKALSGHLEVDGKIIKSKNISPHILRKNKISYVPSNRGFRASNPELSIFELLCANKIISPLINKKKLEKYVNLVLEKEGIDAPLNRKVKTLSGGQLQRLILAREIETNPHLIILAEPEWGLDLQASYNLRKKLKTIACKNTAILILTENPNSFKDKDFFDCVYLVKNNKLEQENLNLHKKGGFN